jgi:Aldo/keto reductase family
VARHRPSDRNLRIADAANTIAKKHDASSAQVAIAWISAEQHRAEMIPIVRVLTCAQLIDNLGSLEIALTAEDLARLDTASAIELGFPHGFGGFRLAYGTTLELIDNHRPQFEVPLPVGAGNPVGGVMRQSRIRG